MIQLESLQDTKGFFMENNSHSINTLVQEILSRNYPFDSEGISLEYHLFNDWNEKSDDPFFYLNKLSDSNDYMALHIVAYILENMPLNFIKNNRKKTIDITKRLLLNDSQRLKFHVLREFIFLMEDNEDFIFYLKVLKESSGIVQNQAVALLRHLNEEKIKIFNENTEDGCFKSFFINDKDLTLSMHSDFLRKKSDIYKKIYITGLYKNNYKKNDLFMVVDEYTNIDLMDYIYVYLD